jgi:hypothetical protein
MSLKTLKKFSELVKERVPTPVAEEEMNKENTENMEAEVEETTPNAG